MTPTRARIPTTSVGGLSSVQIEARDARAVEIRTELDAIMAVQRMRAESERAMIQHAPFLSARRQGKTLLRRELLACVSPLAVSP